MDSSTITQIIALTIAAISAGLDKLFGGTKNPKVSKVIMVIALLAIIFSLVFSLLSKIQEDDEKLNEAGIRDKYHKETVDNAKVMIDSLRLVLNDSKISLKNIDSIKNTARSLSDSLSTNLRMQKSITTSSKELLDRNREMYAAAKKEQATRLENFRIRLKKTIRSINAEKKYISYSSTKVKDSTAAMEKIDNICKNTLKLLSQEHDNPTLIQDESLFKAWQKLGEDVDRIQYYTSGYGGFDVREIRDRLNLAFSDFSYALMVKGVVFE